MPIVPSTSVPTPSDPAPRSLVSTRPRRTRWWAIHLLLAALAGGLAGLAVAAAIHVPRVDSIAEFSPKLITQIYDSAGSPFASYARERRHMLDQGEIPARLRDALVAAEDASFFQHGGIDLPGVVRSVVVNFYRGRRSQGASTITMQVARMLFLSSEKSWKRKISQAFLAVELEKRLSKQQILALYCNLVFLGHGNYGMESAARSFFGHGVKDLSLAEAATLAGIVQRPSLFSPYRNPERVVARRNYVLNQMRDKGMITTEEHREAIAEPLRVARHRRQSEPALFFAEEVRQHLERQFGAERLYQEGLLVHTTLDAGIQEAAERSLREGLLRLDHRRGYRGPIARGQSLELDADQVETFVGRNPVPESWVPGLVLEVDTAHARVRVPEGEATLDKDSIAWTGRRAPRELLRSGDVVWLRPRAEDAAEREPAWTLEQEPQVEGAVIVLESASGAVRALVGGWDFRRNKFDRAIQAQRQVGSAFKPFVYGAAFESGFTPADTLFDAPTLFAGADGLLSYSPRNYYRKYYGILTLRRALEQSVNVTAVKLMTMIGADATISFARRCGITGALPPYPSLALGAADLAPIELAAAYAAFANQGVLVRPFLVDRVLTRSGAVLEQHQLEASKAMEPGVAYVLTSVLEGVVDRGTAAKIADLPLDIAGKTGTTNDYTDAWFVGYTPRYTLLTWVGYDQKRSLGRRMTGAEAALPIWRSLAEAGLESGWLRAGERFTRPPGVENHAVEYWSGLAASPGAEQVIDESFLPGTAPVRTYEPRWARILELPWAQQRPFYTPKSGEHMPDGLSAEVFAAIEAAREQERGGGD